MWQRGMLGWSSGAESELLRVNACLIRWSRECIRRGGIGPVGRRHLHCLCESTGDGFVLPMALGLAVWSQRRVARAGGYATKQVVEELQGFYIHTGRLTPRVRQEPESVSGGRSMRKFKKSRRESLSGSDDEARCCRDDNATCRRHACCVRKQWRYGS
jgi:hypothetical protein